MEHALTRTMAEDANNIRIELLYTYANLSTHRKTAEERDAAIQESNTARTIFRVEVLYTYATITTLQPARIFAVGTWKTRYNCHKRYEHFVSARCNCNN
jgi:hypothetical protein